MTMQFLTGMYDEVLAKVFNRTKAISRLESLQIPIAKHIFLATHYEDDEDALSQWQGELCAWNGDLRLHNKAKRGSKNYTRKMLWTALWEEPFGGDAERLEVAAQVAAEEKLPLVVPDSDKLEKAVDHFVDAVLDSKPAAQFTLPPPPLPAPAPISSHTA